MALKHWQPQIRREGSGEWVDVDVFADVKPGMPLSKGTPADAMVALVEWMWRTGPEVTGARVVVAEVA